MASSKVTIIIVNYNGKRDTIELLDSLKKIDYKNYEIFLVDNNSRDGSQNILKKYAQDKKNITLYLSKINLGLAGASNKGVEHAIKNKSRYVLFMNNDMYVKKDFLIKLVDEIKKDKNIAITGPSILYSEEKEIIWSGEVKFNILKFRAISRGKNIKKVNPSSREVDSLDCVLLAKVDVLKKIGSLYEDFFTMHEFTGLCLNARKNGYRIIYVPSSIVWHKVSKTIGGNGKLITYLGSRNWLAVLKRTQSKRKYFVGIIFHLLLLVPRYIKSIFTKRKFYVKEYVGGIKDFFKGKNKYILN